MEKVRLQLCRIPIYLQSTCPTLPILSPNISIPKCRKYYTKPQDVPKLWSEQKNSRVTNVNSESTKLLASTKGGVKCCQVEEGWRKGVSGTELWKHLAYLVGGEVHCGRILMSLLGVIRRRGTKDRLGHIVKALYAKIRSFGLFRSQWTSEKCFPNLAENHDHLLSLCVSLSFSCCVVERSSCGEGVTTGGTLQQF